MKVATSHSTAVVSGSSRSAVMSLTEKGLGAVSKMLRDQIYTNKKWAGIRETLANALDEHDKFKVERPVEVTLPTVDDPHLRIRDFGKGLPSDKVFFHFFQYFSSDKDHSDDLIGGFGIGAKSPLAYADLFFVTSFFEGVKTCYTSIVEGAQSKAHEMEGVKSSEPSGIEVAIPVKREDFQEFSSMVAEFMGAMLPHRKVSVVNADSDFVVPETPEEILSFDGVTAYRKRPDYPVGGQVMVRDGDILYQLDNPYSLGIRLDFPVVVVSVNRGEVDIHPSRERVDGTPLTHRTIKDKIAAFYKGAETELQRQIDAAGCVKEIIETQKNGSFLNLQNKTLFKNWNVKREGSCLLDFTGGSYERCNLDYYSRWDHRIDLDPRNYFILCGPAGLRYDSALVYARKQDPTVEKIALITDSQAPCDKWVEGKDFWIYDENQVTPEETKEVRDAFGKARAATSAFSGYDYLSVSDLSCMESKGVDGTVLIGELDEQERNGKTVVYVPMIRKTPDHKSELTRGQLFNFLKKTDLRFDVVLFNANKKQQAWLAKEFKSAIDYDTFMETVVKAAIQKWADKTIRLTLPLEYSKDEKIKSIQERLCSTDGHLTDAQRNAHYYAEQYLPENFIAPTKPTPHPEQGKANKIESNYKKLNDEERELVLCSLDSWKFRHFPILKVKSEKLRDDLAK